MKQKVFTHGITFSTTVEMYGNLKQVSDDLGIGMSDLLRGMVEEYWNKRSNPKAYDLPMVG